MKCARRAMLRAHLLVSVLLCDSVAAVLHQPRCDMELVQRNWIELLVWRNPEHGYARLVRTRSGHR